MRPGETIDWAFMLERIRRNKEWQKQFAPQHLECTAALRGAEDALYTYYRKHVSSLTVEQKDALDCFDNREKRKGQRKMDPYTDWTDGKTVDKSHLSAEEVHLLDKYRLLFVPKQMNSSILEPCA